MKQLIFFFGLLAIFVIVLWKAPCMAIETASDDAAKGCVSISDVEIEGNRAFSSFRLKLRMKTWSKSMVPGANKCLNSEWLRRDIQNLITFYRKKGYADVAIESEVVPKNDGPKNKLVLHILEGLRYKLEFQGNTYFSRRQLKSEVDIFKKGNLNDSVLKRGERSMQKRYSEAGFADAAVTYDKVKIQDGDEAFWLVTYTIEEKGRFVVSSLIISNNHHIDEKEIRQAMLTTPKAMLNKGGFSKKILDEDIIAIEQLYRSKGFRNIEVEQHVTMEKTTVAEPDFDEAAERKEEENYPDTMVSIVLTMVEGERVIVTDADIVGTEGLFSKEELMAQIALQPGKPFRDYMIKSDANLIASLISEKGYPHVDVKGDFEIDDTGHGAKVVWKVDRGVFTRVGNISYSGNIKLKKPIVEAQVEITPGEVFSLEKIMAAQKRVRKINAVKTVKIQSPDLQEKKEVANLEVVIEEKKPYYIETAVGYDSRRHAYLNSEIGDSDFLGRDINGAISAEISSIGYKAGAGLKDHFFLNTDMTASSKVYYEKKKELNHNFGVKAWGLSGTLSKPIAEKISVGTGLSYENRTRFGDETAYASYADGDVGNEYKPRNIFITSFFVTYDSRDSVVRPRTGIFTSAYTDIYTGFDNDLDRFVKYILDVRGYRTVLERVTFALRSRFGYIQPFKSGGAVAEDQLFFLGGTTTVRGFDENMLTYDDNGDPVGGKTVAHATIESRISISNAIELLVFFDAGQIKNMGDGSLDRGIRSAAGLGFNYITPIGPVSLMYGHKLDKEEGESDGRVHFSIGYTF